MNDRVVNLLDNYDIEVLRTAKGRGAILCEAKQGYYIFKEYHGHQNKLEFQNDLLKEPDRTRNFLSSRSYPRRTGRFL